MQTLDAEECGVDDFVAFRYTSGAIGYSNHAVLSDGNLLLLASGLVVFLQGCEMDQMLRLMPRATAIFSALIFYARILADPQPTPDAVSLMRLFIPSSAPMLAEIHVEFENRTSWSASSCRIAYSSSVNCSAI